MKQTLLFIAILCCGCQNSISELQTGNYFEVRDLAVSSNKNIWMMLGGGANCRQCNELISSMTEAKIFDKYGDDFVFYKCNTWDPDSQFLHRIFLSTGVPNSYIVNRKGEVISYLQSQVTVDDVEHQLQAVLENHPVSESAHSQFRTTGNELLSMQNYLLQSFAPNLTSEKRIELLDKSISIEPCFYNLYQKYLYTKESGASWGADSCVQNMLSHLKTTYQIVVYDPLITEIRAEGKIRGNQQQYPELTIADSVIDCGKIESNTVHEIVINYQNTGEVPLVITNVYVTCGCLTPEWSKKPLNPGARSRLSIKFSAESSGAFDFPVSILSNCEYKINKISLTGHVK